MYIAPNSTIRILHNVTIDNTYQHTIHFNSSNEQASYFAGLSKYTVANYTYQRKERILRVGILADNLYDCNYIMFQNTSFGNKWFYAFITNVEYVNNEASNITFELDVMQTWYFDYTVRPSFVEREHVASDNVGDNLVPDDLELGEYIADDFDGTNQLGAKSIVVAATFDKDLDDNTGGTYSGIYSGLYYNVFDNYAEVNKFINDAVNDNKGSGIVSIFMMPKNMVGDIGGSVKTYDVNKSKKLTGQIDGYTPKNKKLYTYPYNFLYVTNLNGVGVPFPYEYFSDATNCTFNLSGDMSCNPQIVLCPTNYKGVPANYNEKIILDGFPQCSYNTDAFKAWLAQTGVSQLVSLAGGGAAIAGGVAKAGVATAAGGTALAIGGVPIAAVAGVVSVASVVAGVIQHATLPMQTQNAQGNSAMMALGLKDFAFMHMHIRAEFAEIIDEYWNVYGYPVHRVKLPNISTRRHWNYVKTIDVNIVGSVPADDMAKIKACYNNGITFWRSGSEVGNYSLDNSVGGSD